MPDYSKGKIYTIRSRNDDSLIYVGSTIQPLCVRWGEHKRKSRNGKEIKKYLYQTVNGCWEEWFIELYETFACNSKEELQKREGEIIREIGTLNTRIEGRTKKQWYIENADKIKEQKKKYYNKNADKIKQYHIDNAEKNKQQQFKCECGGHCRLTDKPRHLKTKKHQEYLSTLQE